MALDVEFIVAGGGLAGAFSAYHLSGVGPTVLLEKGHLAAEASGAAVGLINPFMGRKARTIWRFEEAMDGLDRLLEESETTSFFHRTGVWRPAASEKQAGFFQEATEHHRDEVAFFPPQTCRERFPRVAMPFGGLFIKRGGWTDIPDLLEAITRHGVNNRALTLKNGARLTAWHEENDRVVVRTAMGDEICGKHLVLATGYGTRAFDALRQLDLHDVKGQALRLEVSPELSAALPCMSGTAHIIPLSTSLAIGSTYEHAFEHLRPTDEGREIILDKARKVVPALPSEPVVWSGAGARVTVPVSRLPMLDRIQGSDKIWIFTGLGTKGLLMAALLSKELPGFIRNPASVPAETRLRLRS